MSVTVTCPVCSCPVEGEILDFPRRYRVRKGSDHDRLCRHWVPGTCKNVAPSNTASAEAVADIAVASRALLRGIAALEEADTRLCRLMVTCYGGDDQASQRSALSDAIQVIRKLKDEQLK